MLARRQPTYGQVVVILAVSLTVMLMVTGLVLDGAFGLAQRRHAQNAADLAALAGARVMAAFVTNDPNATDANVKQSIDMTVAANDTQPLTYGGTSGPQYVSLAGVELGPVGDGVIPDGAVGVRVTAARSWKPFFAGLFGVPQWSTQASATARGGYRAGSPPPGNLLPIGISEATYASFPICAAGVPKANCFIGQLTEGTDNVPGAFGWLKFGCGNLVDDNGNPYDLGQTSPPPGCEESEPFLEGEWGNLGATPPDPPNTYGCCTEVGLQGSGDNIGRLPGDTASLNASMPGVAYYIDNEVIGFVPIWDYAGGPAQDEYYHISGFAGFQVTGISGSGIQGILRQVIFPGPVAITAPGFAGAPLAIQLIK